MEIRFVSSLSSEDEERLARPLLQLVCFLLDQVPLAYSLRIETIGGTAIQTNHELEHSNDEAVAADNSRGPREINSTTAEHRDLT